MPDVVSEAQHDYWRPPVVPPQAISTSVVQVCEGCATEFMVGSLYCQVCGTARDARPSITAHWTTYLQFHHIKRALGLSTASLMAFFVGIACLIMASIAVSLIYSVQTFNDFQAVQFYRMQWLLGAIAAFAAGLLLKNTSGSKR